MMDMNSGLETEIVATGVVAMLGMAVWLFFRRETNGEKSLFSKMMAPNDDEIEKCASVTQFIPSFKGNSAKGVVKTQYHGIKALNQRMSNSSFVREKELPMKAPNASTIKLQEGETTGQVEAFGQSSGRVWNKSEEMISGQKTLGGILVVDDDPHIRKLIRLILENVGYYVLEAEDGQEAINVLSSGETPMVVDLIITDLNMPKVDGFEAIAYFQKEYPSIPVIVLTGIGDPEVEASFMRQGVSDYLAKPVDVRTLMASVANAIAQEQFSWA
jgi:two-component system chemotaxis response regulator CheY